MSFQKIAGQDAAVRILQDELKSGRIHHAYLFTGKRGIGKKTTAVEFAKALFCKDEGIDSCEKCLSCRKIEHKNHPDLIITGIEEGDSIKIDQIRELQRELSYKPFDGRWKVHIIEDADSLTPEAANSLLKTLEEPPQYGVIILLAEELDQLLPTVISRCQKIQFNPLSVKIIEAKLLEEGYQEEDTKLIARLADGSLGRAFELIKNEDFPAQRKKILERLYKISELDAVSIFRFVDELISFINDMDESSIFYLILSWYRDIILYNQGYYNEIINYDYLEQLKLSSQYYSLEELISIMELVNNIEGYIKSNVKKDLALQVMMFKIRAKKVK
ncbi:MAG: DNA polymerase III subunit delta' [Halanaerobiaceae bacterium]|nr:DNA polymerase III subunit delta' [Halanaerobiaceae bacterium]